MIKDQRARKELGRMFAKARVSRGWTQIDVADYLSLNRQTYQYYEAGRSEPSLFDGFKLCKLLGINLDEIKNLRVEEVVVKPDTKPRKNTKPIHMDLPVGAKVVTK